MISRAGARACANIALVKYWGKQGPGNAPATPSIALALEALSTETTVERLASGKDRISIDGKTPAPAARRRVVAYIDRLRKAGLISGSFSVTAKNTFPTAAGLASSASGFAALATALSAFSPRRPGLSGLSRMARQGSGSAARSITGGLSALPAGEDPAARLIAAPEDVPWGMVVAITASGKKAVPSRKGMELSRIASPFYQAWVGQAKQDYRAMLKALKSWDLEAVGSLTEANMLAMHSCMMATRPALVYWNPATLRLVNSTGTWRKNGTQVYATVDAGPQVIFLCGRSDVEKVCRLARRVEGVMSVIPSLPGGPATLVRKQ